MAEDRADANTGTGTGTHDRGWFASGDQAARIGAAGILLTTLIGVCAPLPLFSVDDDGGAAAAPTTPTPTPSAEPPGSTPPASTPAPAPTSARVERRHGTPAFGSQSKELDDGQPVPASAGRAGDLEISGRRDQPLDGHPGRLRARRPPHRPARGARAHHWARDVFRPTARAAPRELRGSMDAAELYHELLEHR